MLIKLNTKDELNMIDAALRTFIDKNQACEPQIAAAVNLLNKIILYFKNKQS